MATARMDLGRVVGHNIAVEVVQNDDDHYVLSFVWYDENNQRQEVTTPNLLEEVYH